MDYEARLARRDWVMTQLEDTQIVMASIEERQAGVQRLQAEEIDAIRSRQAEHETTVRHIESNLAEATDKLNALIDLMDRHQREHRQ